MFSGTRRVPRGAHVKAIQSVGGNVNASTSTDSTNYRSVVAHEHYRDILALEAERLLHLADDLDSAAVAQEVGVVSNERYEQDGRPYGDVNETVAGLLFPPRHPYAHLPLAQLDDVRRAPHAAVAGFFRRHYRPEKAVIAIAGSVEPEEAFDAVDFYFKNFSGSGTSESLPKEFSRERGLGSGDCARVDRAGASGQRLFVGLLVPPAAIYANERIKVLAQLLAGGRGGLLLQLLGRERRLVSDVNIRFMTQARQNAVCVVELVALPGVDLDDLESAYRDVMGSINVSRLPVRALERLIGLYRSAWLCNRDRVGGYASDLSFSTLFQGDPDANDSVYSAVMRTSLADLHEMSDYFRPNQDSAVVRYHHVDG